MKLSYSQISAYKTCPLQYRFRYVERRPLAPNPSLSFGKSMHSALEWLYSVPTPHPPSLEELLDELEVCWLPEGYESAEQEARYFYQGRSTLELYYRKNILETDDPFRIPAGLEQRFSIDLDFCTLTGVIDRLDRNEEGAFEIIDYKTNRRLPPISRLRQDLQLPIYQIAAQSVWDVRVARVTFHYLLHDHKVSFIISADRERDALSEIERVARCVGLEEFDPIRNNLCPWCDFLDECPLMAGTPSRKGEVAAPSLEVGQAVDELLLLAGRAEGEARRMEGLRSLISRYLSAGGAERVAGNRGTATLDGSGNLLLEREDEGDGPRGPRSA